MPEAYNHIALGNPKTKGRPTLRDIDRFENTHRIALPASYREFCLRFGAGELGGIRQIASPMPARYDGNDYELARFNRDWHGPPDSDWLASYGPPGIVSRLFFFASTGGGEGYAWHLDEPTDAERHEYKVYYLPRYVALVPVADSFSEFIEKQCLAPIRRPNGEIWQPEPEFWRFEL